MHPREMAAVAAAVLRRPTLWATALVQLVRLAAPGWWRRLPFLPLPDPAYLRFRRVTAYGDPAHRLEPDDVVAWLGWCRTWRRVSGAAHRGPARPAGVHR